VSKLIGNTHTQSTLDDGLIAYYNFDNADVLDQTTNNNNGSIV
jgi:hypothetical protein